MSSIICCLRKRLWPGMPCKNQQSRCAALCVRECTLWYTVLLCPNIIELRRSAKIWTASQSNAKTVLWSLYSRYPLPFQTSLNWLKRWGKKSRCEFCQKIPFQRRPPADDFRQCAALDGSRKNAYYCKQVDKRTESLTPKTFKLRKRGGKMPAHFCLENCWPRS